MDRYPGPDDGGDEPSPTEPASGDAAAWGQPAQPASGERPDAAPGEATAEYAAWSSDASYQQGQAASPGGYPATDQPQQTYGDPQQAYSQPAAYAQPTAEQAYAQQQPAYDPWGQQQDAAQQQAYAQQQPAYDPNAYAQQPAYDPNAYAQQQQAYAQQQQAYAQQQGYDPNAYAQQGYDPNAYAQQQQAYAQQQQAYAQQQGYAQPAYDPNAYAQQQQAYGQQPWQPQQPYYDQSAYGQQQPSYYDQQAYTQQWQQGYAPGQPYAYAQPGQQPWPPDAQYWDTSAGGYGRSLLAALAGAVLLAWGLVFAVAGAAIVWQGNLDRFVADLTLTPALLDGIAEFNKQAFAWGAIFMIVGITQFIGGVGIFAHRSWGRAFGVVLGLLGVICGVLMVVSSVRFQLGDQQIDGVLADSEGSLPFAVVVLVTYLLVFLGMFVGRRHFRRKGVA